MSAGPITWLVKSTAGTGLTIRSSRARFAASALAGYDLTIANAAQRPGLAQALARSRKRSRSKCIRPSSQPDASRLAWGYGSRHKLRAD